MLPLLDHQTRGAAPFQVSLQMLFYGKLANIDQYFSFISVWMPPLLHCILGKDPWTSTLYLCLYNSLCPEDGRLLHSLKGTRVWYQFQLWSHPQATSHLLAFLRLFKGTLRSTVIKGEQENSIYVYSRGGGLWLVDLNGGRVILQENFVANRSCRVVWFFSDAPTSSSANHLSWALEAGEEMPTSAEKHPPRISS